jgi:NAD(P)-dependent dehydrogenase (short-subunit alcohol dehydrogenase family)
MANIKFTPEKRAAFVAGVAGGIGRTTAAKRCGVTLGTVTRIMAADPEFKEAVEAAEAILVDVAEKRLWEAVDAGEPWAVKEALATQRRDKWGAKQTLEVKGEVTHLLKASPTEGILQLQRDIEQRKLALEMTTYEDAEVVDESE